MTLTKTFLSLKEIVAAQVRFEKLNLHIASPSSAKFNSQCIIYHNATTCFVKLRGANLSHSHTAINDK